VPCAAPERFYFWFVLTPFSFLTGMRPDIASEENRVKSRVISLMENKTPGAPSFRSEQAKAYVLSVLQEQVSQVGNFVESFHSAMAAMYRTMFPLNPQPQRFEDLTKKFSSVRRIKALVREQLIGGAKVALAFVRAHHPNIELGAIGRSLPVNTEDGRLEMEVLYDIAHLPATQLIHRVEAETKLLIERGWVPPEEEHGALAL